MNRYKLAIKPSIINFLLLSIAGCSLNSVPSEGLPRDDYAHLPLCGYADSNGRPCDDLSSMKIYTGVPYGRGDTIERMNNVNEIVGLWVNDNRNIISERGLEVSLENIGGRNDYFPAIEGELKIGIFVFYDDSGAILSLQSVTDGGVQAISYYCNYNLQDTIDEECLMNKVNEGMGKLLESFL